MKSKTLITTLAALAALTTGAVAQVDLEISEVMYRGTGGEFIEVYNEGGSAVNMAGGADGFSFDDSSDNPDSLDLSGVGTLESGDLFIITEVSCEVFVQYWFVDANQAYPDTLAAIVENNNENIGSSDTMYIYDGNDNTVEQLAYDTNAGGPDPAEDSAVPDDVVDLGDQLNLNNWTLSNASSDDDDAWQAGANGEGAKGSPGVFSTYNNDEAFTPGTAFNPYPFTCVTP